MALCGGRRAVGLITDGREIRMEIAMSEVGHRTIETNGIRMHIAEQGEGPLVVLCHGFPESWYSWRHQLRALAEAGFHAVAPDMRGYGQTDAPAEIEKYTLTGARRSHGTPRCCGRIVFAASSD
jgi:pimeloyl-ACP methyl ester carboxylesterase